MCRHFVPSPSIVALGGRKTIVPKATARRIDAGGTPQSVAAPAAPEPVFACKAMQNIRSEEGISSDRVMRGNRHDPRRRPAVSGRELLGGRKVRLA